MWPLTYIFTYNSQTQGQCVYNDGIDANSFYLAVSMERYLK